MHIHRMCGFLRAEGCLLIVLAGCWEARTEGMVSPGGKVYVHEENTLCAAKGASFRIRDLLGSEGGLELFPSPFSHK